MNNRYVNRAKISEGKFRELIRFFAIDLNAIQIAKLTRLNRNTVNRYLTEIRRKIDTYCITISAAERVKMPVENQNEDLSYIVLIREHSGGMNVDLFYRDPQKNMDDEGWSAQYAQKGYDLLIDIESGRHFYLQTKNDTNSYRIRLNRMESFWSSAKSRLAKFKGLHSSTLRYHLRECEFRYNNRDKDIYKLLLKILRNDPLF